MKKFLSKILIFIVFNIPAIFGIKFLISSFSQEYFQIFEFLFGLFLLCVSLLYWINILFPVDLTNVNINLEYENLKKPKYKYSKYLSLLFSVLFLIFGFNAYQNSKTKFDKADLKELQITLSEKPKFTGKTHSLNGLKTNQFPDFVFSVPSYFEKILENEKFDKKQNVNDTLTIFIKQDDYLKKIAGTIDTNFIEKYFEWKFISVYGISSKIKKYYNVINSIQDFQQSKKESAFFSFGISFLLLMLTIYIWKSKNKIKI